MSNRTFIALPQMLTGIVIYLLHIVLRNVLIQYNYTLIRYYIADYITLIICIPLFINIQVYFNVRKTNYIKLYEILFYFIIFSVYFEFIGPRLFPKRMTQDPLDIFFYLLGGLVLYFSQKAKKPIL